MCQQASGAWRNYILVFAFTLRYPMPSSMSKIIYKNTIDRFSPAELFPSWRRLMDNGEHKLKASVRAIFIFMCLYFFVINNVFIFFIRSDYANKRSQHYMAWMRDTKVSVFRYAHYLFLCLTANRFSNYLHPMTSSLFSRY